MIDKSGHVEFHLPQEDGDDEVPMAPMIDMVFLLLIFFMVASNLNQMEKVEIDVPVAENAKVAKDMQSRRTITVKNGGQIYLGNRPSELEEVGPAIRDHLKKVPGLKIFLRADKSVEFAQVRDVMKACAEAGAAEIIFATYEKE